MKRDPRTKIRSEWIEHDEWAAKLRTMGGIEPDGRVFQRNVHDGHLTALLGTIPEDMGGGVHMSISHRTNQNPPQPGRYPTWDEIADARYKFCPTDVTMAMLLPPESEYVAVHSTTFHLHEIVAGREFIPEVVSTRTGPENGVVTLADREWWVEVGMTDDGDPALDADGFPLARLVPVEMKGEDYAGPE